MRVDLCSGGDPIAVGPQRSRGIFYGTDPVVGLSILEGGSF